MKRPHLSCFYAVSTPGGIHGTNIKKPSNRVTFSTHRFLIASIFIYIMKAGILLPQTGDSASRDNVLYIAKEAEREGFNSVWVLERLLWAVKPQTPYAGTPDGSLPVEYQNVLDPLG
jgi:hypothetical protein